MIAARTPLVLSAIAGLLACGQAPPEPAEPPPFEPDGPPALTILVDVDPDDDTEGFVSVTAPARYGDPFTVIGRNFWPGDRVTLEAELYGLTSSALFEAADDGTIDLRRDAPLDGAWSDVDAEGLLWSMDGTEATGQLDLTVTVRARVDEDEVAAAALERRHIDDALTVEEIAQGTTRGLLALPPGDGPFPAVLAFGGSEGGTGSGEFRAMYLASLGVASLGVGYFGAPGLPAELEEVPLEILEGDLAFLAADPRIDPERIAVMGGSRGGELALLLGERFPVVKGVIATVPSGLVWGAANGSGVAAWTDAGQPLPFMPWSGAGPEVRSDADGDHVQFRGTFLADIENATASELDAATIRAERSAGPVLLIAGDDDQLWPSCVLAQVAMDRLLAAGRAGDALLCLPDAGHAIGMPGWSTLDTVESWHDDLDAFMVLGGTPQGNARAARAADTAIRAFLKNL